MAIINGRFVPDQPGFGPQVQNQQFGQPQRLGGIRPGGGAGLPQNFTPTGVFTEEQRLAQVNIPTMREPTGIPAGQVLSGGIFGGQGQGAAGAGFTGQQSEFSRLTPEQQRTLTGGQFPTGQVQPQPVGQPVPLQQGTLADNQVLVPGGQIQPQPFGPPQALQQAPQQGLPPGVPQTGIIGSEQALQAGLGAQLGVLNQFGRGALTALGGAQDEATALLNRARGDVNQQFGQAVQGFQPFQQGGTSAFNQQAALSGALGPEAQQQAFNEFTASPGQQFLQEQGQRQIASTVGRRGFSGDAIREAARFGQGLAQQDFGNQFNRLGQLSGQGLQAQSAIGNLRAQQGGLLSGQGQFGAGQAFNFGQAGANQLANLGINQANVFGGVASNVARGREAFGQNLGTALGTGAASISGLQERGGAGASDILGGAATNAATIAQNFGNLSAADQQQLAVLLANLQTQQGSQLAGQPSPAQFIESGGLIEGIGQLASGVGGGITGFAAGREAGLF